EGCGQLRPEARGDLDPGRLPHCLVDAVCDLVDLLVVHSHPVQHEVAVDTDHVAVPAAQVAREQLQHRGPECELTGLAFTNEERYGRPEGEDLVGQPAGKLASGTPDPVLHGPVDHFATGREGLFDDCAGDLCAPSVADDGYPVVRVDVEAGSNGVAGAGGVLRQHDRRVYRAGRPPRIGRTARLSETRRAKPAIQSIHEPPKRSWVIWGTPAQVVLSVPRRVLTGGSERRRRDAAIGNDAQEPWRPDRGLGRQRPGGPIAAP